MQEHKEDCEHAHKRSVGADRCFTGPVSHDAQNQAAHGGIERTVVCDSCGAERLELRNGLHVEAGNWVAKVKPDC